MARVNTGLLGEIATAYLGAPVAVGLDPAGGLYMGEALYIGVYMIRLRADLADTPEKLAEVYCHELGHLLCGHVSRKTVTIKQYGLPEAERLASGGDPWFVGLVATIERLEAEADAKGAELRAELEAAARGQGRRFVDLVIVP
jgi:hypothetical protein